MARNLGGRTDAWRAGRCAAQQPTSLVSGNSGPAHLAAAVGTPVVSLFSPVVPGRPLGAVQEFRACCSAISRRPARTAEPGTARFVGHPCLNEVTPQDVVRGVQKLLKESA